MPGEGGVLRSGVGSKSSSALGGGAGGLRKGSLPERYGTGAGARCTACDACDFDGISMC